MSERLVFPDPLTAADALTFAGRAARLGDGAVRLRADHGTLVLTSAPLAPRGIGDATPTVLAMRALTIDPELECDLVVPGDALAAASDDLRALVLPDVGLAPAWAGVSPPRGGWTPSSTIAASELAARAQWGIAAVAEGVPSDPGEDVVRTVRTVVWGEPDAAIAGLPRGAAFAAFALGFIGGEEDARVYDSGPWTRVSLRRGHVLTRRPARIGLTEVRRTGAA